VGLRDDEIDAAVPVQVTDRQRSWPAVDSVLGLLDREPPALRAQREPDRLVLEAPER
jgi:hypothetical protein